MDEGNISSQAVFKLRDPISLALSCEEVAVSLVEDLSEVLPPAIPDYRSVGDDDCPTWKDKEET